MHLLSTSPEIQEILDSALEGKRITEGDSLKLMQAKGDDVLAIGITANKIREKKVGQTATYIVNRNINFTNICVGRCNFCAFRRNSGDSDAFFLKPTEILKKVKEAKKAGATEVCIQGGLHPDIDISFYVEILKKIKRSNGIHTHAFSPMEIFYASKRSGLSIGETLKALKDAGLDSMPGTAAEILDDRVRKKICPKKLKTKEWITVIKEAHSLGIPTTATILYGHVETPEEQVKHMSILRGIQDETRGFTEFIPLSFVHFKTPLYTHGDSREGSTGVEDIKIFSVARIFLDNFRNIQASWVKLGRKFSQVMLNFGANDLGGTLMEESISKSAGLTCQIVSRAELERMIREAGRVPRERDTLYNIKSSRN